VRGHRLPHLRAYRPGRGQRKGYKVQKEKERNRQTGGAFEKEVVKKGGLRFFHDTGAYRKGEVRHKK